jgi:hypothetical protein
MRRAASFPERIAQPALENLSALFARQGVLERDVPCNLLFRGTLPEKRTDVLGADRAIRRRLARLNVVLSQKPNPKDLKRTTQARGNRSDSIRVQHKAHERLLRVKEQTLLMVARKQNPAS